MCVHACMHVCVCPFVCVSLVRWQDNDSLFAGRVDGGINKKQGQKERKVCSGVIQSQCRGRHPVCVVCSGHLSGVIIMCNCNCAWSSSQFQHNWFIIILSLIVDIHVSVMVLMLIKRLKDIALCLIFTL